MPPWRLFAALRAMPCDVFLASHGSFYGLEDKYARTKKVGPNPFIDPAGFQAHIDLKEKEFQVKLQEQKAAQHP